MPQVLKSPVRYVGGKAHLAERIIALLPQRRSCYVEVFGGAGHVMTRKPMEENEVFNDVQSVVTNFFLVLREHPDELQRRIERMPVSRAEHARLVEWWKKGCPGPVTDIERAVRWFYLLKTSFSGMLANSYAYGLGKNVGMIPHAFCRTTNQIDRLAERWRGVNIENQDFERLISRYSAEGVVFYCDPPYVGAEEYYESSGFTGKDHARLAAVLNASSCRVMVSYYPHPLVAKLYPKTHWRAVRINVAKASAASKLNDKKPRGVELLLMNYDADGRLLRRAGGKSRR